VVQSGSQLKMHVSFNHVSVENLFYRHLWKLSIPKNVVIYIWRLLVNRLPTMDNLLSRGVDVQYMGSVKILKGFPRLSMIGNNRILKPMVLTNNQ